MRMMQAIALHWRRRVPLVLQTEAAECGLACLAMVLGYYGVITDLATLRRQYTISLKGMTLAVLSNVAQKAHLGTRAVRLEVGELGRLQMPAILHWELNHFVVLKSVQGKRAVIVDPAVGERRIGPEELSQKFTGVALELWPNPGFMPKDEKARISLSQLIGQVSGLWPALSQVLMMSAGLEVLALVAPLFMQWILDHVLVSHDTSLLATLAVGFLLLLVVQAAIGTVRSWTLLVINTTVRVQWRTNVLSHLLRLPIDYFQKRHLGDVVSRAGAVDDIQRLLGTAVVEALFDGLLAIVTLVLMAIYSTVMTSIALAAVAVYLLLRVLWYQPLYNATEEAIVRGAVTATHFLESIRGVRAIKLFCRQAERRNAWLALFSGETNAQLRISKLRIWYGLARSMLGGGFNIVLLWVGASQVLDSTLSIGMLMAFLAYRGQFDSRISRLIDQIIDLRMINLYGERLADIVLTEPDEDASEVGLLPSDGTPPTVKLSNVRFRYADPEPWVLDGISMTIAPGESVAIVGVSGSGKSTLGSLLLASQQPTEGSIHIGDTPLVGANKENWRRAIGSVQQDDTLFAGSLVENISFFDPAVDLERVRQSAKLAGVHDEIKAMAMGYQTLVGDMGAAFSGGQRQRILLARALYQQPRVLILDEATSHLDLRLEAVVNRAIASLKMTRIVIAHRPQTIESAQRVIELEGGKVVFDGPSDVYLKRLAQQVVDAAQ